MASSCKKVKTYHFHSEWEEQYFFTEVKDKNVCLLCNTSVSVAKKGNIERHHKTVHSNFEKSFPLHSAARKEKLKQLIGQQSIFLRTVDKNKAATEASYRVSQIIAQKKKPYEDGEMIKQAFLEAADSLFANFRNKDEIVSAIKSMQLSANTVMRRVEVMSNDIFLQLRTDLDNCVYFSLELDESTDVVDTAQMAVFVRMVFSDFTIKEDLLKFIPLKGHTTGQELFSHLKNIISSEKIPISKMVGLTTDGAPAMVGCDKGLVALCRKDETFPQFPCYHCIIHQQALCGNFLKLNNVMKLVVKIVNKIRAQALQRRLFRTLADEVDCQYGDLLLHSEVRWLSRGRVLKRFNDVLSGIVQFFKQRDEPTPELENSIWLRDFGFLVDITEKLNELNLQLQGRDKELAEMISDIKV
uniref:General transcription factor II-I repeat domain-containing protein 2-like n=1 Tax=Diabrotica virgifera virgifera TaxID=50390 RepID=A0A6P7F3L2_DIAVI